MNKSDLRSWIIVVGIALSFFIWGIFLFSTVGDKEPPNWDFGAVQDIPGQSPYSTDSAKQFPTLFSPSGQTGKEVRKQHVMGRSEETETAQAQKEGDK